LCESGNNRRGDSNSTNRKADMPFCTAHVCL
jgi:hypothetical protein